MCFRPSVVEDNLVCPQCGKKINAIGGRLPLECPFCEADISELAKEMMPSNQSSLLNNTKPAAPAAPAPKQEGVPAAPKPGPVE